MNNTADNTLKQPIEISNQIEKNIEFSIIGDWIWEIKNNKIKWANRTYEIFGESPDTFDLSFESYIAKIHPEDRSKVEEHIEKTLTINKYFKSLKHRIVLSDGRTKYVNCNANVELNENGQAKTIFGTIEDVTNRSYNNFRNKITDKLSPTENILFEVFKKKSESTDQEKLQHKLSLAQAELETFVHMASHVLRGPLSNILGVCNIAYQEAFTNINVALLIEEISINLNNNLNDLLKVTELNKSIKNTQKLKLYYLVAKAIQKTNNNINSSIFKINIPVNTVIESNSQLLLIAIKKIIENSIKYSELSERETIIEINYYQTNKNIVVINDNGIGISNDIIDNIFTMFYRGNTSSKGTGLGLYITKKAMEKLNGKIYVETKQNEGTKVTLVF